MVDRTELRVSHAAASLHGDLATIALVTDQGEVILRMHRLDLGALGGSIARALWPKAGESIPTAPVVEEEHAEASVALTEAEPDSVPTQPDLHEPEAAPAAATAEAEPHSIPTQPDLHEPEPAPAAVASADAEPEILPTQPGLPEQEAEISATIADAVPESIPTQPEHEPDVTPSIASSERSPDRPLAVRGKLPAWSKSPKIGVRFS